MEIKGIQRGKNLQSSIFADDMTLYIRYPKNSMGKLLKVINKASRQWTHYIHKRFKEKFEIYSNKSNQSD